MLTLVISILLSIHNAGYSLETKNSAMTEIYIDPDLTVTQVNATFSVNISVSEVEDLASWQAFVYFEKDILDASTCSEGSFLNSHGPTSFVFDINNDFNVTHGELWMYCYRTWAGAGVDGSGTLGIATFKAEMIGNSPLDLTFTILGNSTAQRISHEAIDGSVQITIPVTIIDITSFAPIAAQGFLLPINITTQNSCEIPATFNLTAYYNTTEIETQEITQPNETNLTITFLWDTAETELYQIYIISASTGSNTSTNGLITVVYPGDVDIDHDVDIFDVVMIAAAYGSHRGDTSYKSIGDINCDNNIDIFDVVIAAGNYGYRE